MKRYFLLFTFYFLLCLSACSIPNLEKPECREARDAAREFYSFHYSNDTKFNRENLTKREKFLTPELFQTLSQKPDSDTDYFTNSTEPPKAFRIGKCEVTEPNQKTNLEIVLIWKDEETSRQKEVQAEAVKENDKWLINRIDAK